MPVTTLDTWSPTTTRAVTSPSPGPVFSTVSVGGVTTTSAVGPVETSVAPSLSSAPAVFRYTPGVVEPVTLKEIETDLSAGTVNGPVQVSFCPATAGSSVVVSPAVVPAVYVKTSGRSCVIEATGTGSALALLIVIV